MLIKIAIAILVAALIIAILIQWARRQSITNTKPRNRYFRKLAQQLELTVGGDEYYLHLEGAWKGTKIIILTHNFHGTGIITLIYADTEVARRDRTWIEPTLGLGRAIIEAKQSHDFSFEVSGNTDGLPVDELLGRMKQFRGKYPYLAFTLPERFIFSPYLTSRDAWPNFMIFVALDAGRKPPIDTIRAALDSAVELTQTSKKRPS